MAAFRSLHFGCNKMDMTLVRYALMANPTIQHAVQFWSNLLHFIMTVQIDLDKQGDTQTYSSL